MQMHIDAVGTVRCLYHEAIPLERLGRCRIRRASRVEPDGTGQWWIDLTPVGGPVLGPFRKRSAALETEVAWIEEHLLSNRKGKSHDTT